MYDDQNHITERKILTSKEKEKEKEKENVKELTRSFKIGLTRSMTPKEHYLNDRQTLCKFSQPIMSCLS
jgi:hypothetical protein